MAALFHSLEQCIFSKMWIGQNWATTVPADLLTVELMSALQDKNKSKVVLVAHSQGTIIASDVLWRLWEAVDNGQLPEVSLNICLLVCVCVQGCEKEAQQYETEKDIDREK